MIGIVLVTHGNLADEFLSAMQHVVGPQTGVECVGIVDINARVRYLASDRMMI